jgi:hypothetical protein
LYLQLNIALLFPHSVQASLFPLAATVSASSAISASLDVSEDKVFSFGLLILPDAACRVSVFRPVINTFAPFSINVLAVANPIPALPPVITTFYLRNSSF